ncbi:MAG: hypothetical protein Kow0027_06160 [Saprospiraceae bacterium]
MTANKALNAPLEDPPAEALRAPWEDDKGGVGACLIPADQPTLAPFVIRFIC